MELRMSSILRVGPIVVGMMLRRQFRQSLDAIRFAFPDVTCEWHEVKRLFDSDFYLRCEGGSDDLERVWAWLKELETGVS
jgi:hypothetical protein